MTEFYPFNIGSKRRAVPSKLKALAEQVAAQICGYCKNSRNEILDCDGRTSGSQCEVFQLRPDKHGFKKLIMTQRRKCK